jgi:hypothetical protein
MKRWSKLIVKWISKKDWLMQKMKLHQEKSMLKNRLMTPILIITLIVDFDNDSFIS